ncbi:Dipeptide transport ATP-binding protein DppD (TC 3.A.1.5.2) [Gulosibacter sp. 10]|nr:Dipeptide transport ATP-binding protein DppD (TC 3.A.1.5.2) [Gulosibacter sp. 10]
MLRVVDLTVRFPDRKGGWTRAVEGVSFDVRPGEILAIVGESGSGKSVTARSLVGLAGADASITGKISLGDEELEQLREREWRTLRGSRIGFVLQDALTSLDPLRTIGHEIGEAVRVHHRGLSRADVTGRVEGALRDAGIDDPEQRRRQFSFELSGGLRQRSLIASAVVNGPDVLIADEPTTALDVTVQRRILRLLRRLADEGAAIVFISHDLAVVSELADRTVVLRDGSVQEQGATAELLRSPRSAYTRELLAAIPDPSHAQRRREGTAPSESPVAVIRGARVTFHGPKGSTRAALDDVSMELRAGETLGLVGESGSGKTTLGRVLLGLQRLDSGAVELFGRRWDAAPEASRRRDRHRIQVISQDPSGTFNPLLNVGELLDQSLRLHSGLARGARRDRALELLESVGLGERHLDVKPRRLSGGQRQRVSIAQALASDPEVLVCDEPVSALDVITQAQVLDLLRRVQRDRGLSMLFISHDLAVVESVSHRTAVMRHGRIVEIADAASIFERPEHPYTRELLDAIPGGDFAGRRAAEALAGASR